MVGAGFSKNAESLTSIRARMPSWTELVSELTTRLNPEDKQTSGPEPTTETSSALRLAQEFEAAEGRPALIQLVRETIAEESFAPGKLHVKLLELPWADVFTTNYDCLLEKASRKVRRQTFDVIRGVADIPSARRPRIVKLHGTLPELENMILTEDDFRHYPSRHEPFVNLVQTSLAENSFCLLGFSGDDPNFLRWTGWVRDKLGENTPFIFFFRYSDVPLRTFQRRLLESRRIVPIDLNELYPNCDAQEAHRQLLHCLKETPGPLKPSWDTAKRYVNNRIDTSIATEPRCNSRSTADDWKAAIKIWQEHRKRYNRWIVLPQVALQRLADDVVSSMKEMPRQFTIDWPIVDRLVFVRELIWRAATACFPLLDDFVFNMVDPVLRDIETSINRKDVHGQLTSWGMTRENCDDAVFYIRCELLRHAREIGDNRRFSELREQCVSALGKTSINDGGRHFVTHQIVLWELGRLNHIAARKELLTWKTQTASPIWKVRRGALLLECGEVERGRGRLEEAFHQIRSVPCAPTDYESLTTEGCLLTVLRFLWHSDDANRQLPVNENIHSYSVADSENDSTHREVMNSDGGTNVQDTDPITLSAENMQKDPVERDALERLDTLTRLGCDPASTLMWFHDVLEYRPRKQLGQHAVETYDVGRVSYTTTCGDNPPLQRAHQAIRFIEDAAIPLSVSRTISVDVAGKVFANAAMLIAEYSTGKDIGPVLRSRNDRLIREFLSRRRVALATTSQVEFLRVSAIDSLRSSLKSIDTPPPVRTDADTFWERNLELACIVLDRVSARLTQDMLRQLIEELLPLSWDQRLMGRLNGYDDLNRAILRCCTLLSRESVGAILATCIQSPALGSEFLPVSAVRVGNWIDPVTEMDAAVPQLHSEQREQVSQRVGDLLSRGFQSDTVERGYLISRLFALKSHNLLSGPDQIRLLGLLFHKVDKNGMPLGIRIVATYAVLSLPRHPLVKERELFRKAVVDQCDEGMWRTLAFSVSRFGLPREDLQRSIKWTRSDLKAILQMATEWILKTHAAFRDNTGRGLPRLMPEAVEIKNGDYRSWLQVVEEVLLLAPNRNEAIVEDCWKALKTAESHGFQTLKVWPTLVQLQKINVEDAVSEIRLGLSSNNDELVWQACCAIVRWAELERERHPVPLPPRCLETLGTLLLDCRHAMLPLLLNTSRDLVGIFGRGLSAGFQADLFAGLNNLLLETEYFGYRSRRAVNQRIHLRQIALKLVNALREIGVQHAVFDKWASSAREDVFEDVRRLV